MRVAKKITDRVADLIENLATNMPLHRDASRRAATLGTYAVMHTWPISTVASRALGRSTSSLMS